MIDDQGLTQGTIVTEPPTVEPVTLTQARAQLAVEAGDTSRDGQLTGFIAAAHRYVEGALGYPVMRQTRQTHLYGFPRAGIWISGGADLDVDDVEYRDTAGDLQTLDDGDYIVDSVSMPTMIVPAPGRSWPVTVSRPSAVIVTWSAGWDDEGEVPGDLVHAMLMLIGHWDMNREAVFAGGVSKAIEFAVDALINPWRTRVV
jgi:uncharacterized phiE125 gp8 family phage protein